MKASDDKRREQLYGALLKLVEIFYDCEYDVGGRKKIKRVEFFLIASLQSRIAESFSFATPFITPHFYSHNEPLLRR
jgi:hypothetical protein